MFRMTRRVLTMVGVLVGMSLAIAACGDTWEGAKKDTRDNVKATGKGIENAGEAIKKSVD